MAEGRRERMREKIRSRGAHGLPPHEVVEFLLYPFIPRKDTSPLAKLLLKQFGGMEGLFNAKEEELLRVPGMTKMAAVTFPLYKDLLSVTVEAETMTQIKDLTTPKDAGEFCVKLLLYSSNEKVMAVYVNNLGRVLGHRTISEGNTVSAPFDVISICRGALVYDADGVIITHNHPTGNLKPSLDDVVCTEDLQKHLKEINVKLLDHIIVNKEEYLSMRKEGYIK